MSIQSKLRQLGRVAADSRWWGFYLQRQFLRPAWRNRSAAMVAKYLRPKASLASSAGPDTSRRIAEMRDAGLTHFGPLLTNDQAAHLHAYFQQKLVADPYRAGEPAFPPQSTLRHPDSHIAHHNAQDILRAPYLLSVANRPDILAVVEGILGCKPTLGYLAAWWSYHTDKGAQQAEHFHRDVDDWRFVKLFIYLSDVGRNNGPHIYVSHSSASPELRHIRRFTDEEVISVFGASRVLELTGKAGEGFLEDTFGIHKGQPVAEGQRLIFQAVYGMSPLPYGPKTPVLTGNEIVLDDGSTPDAWINRVYLKYP